LEHEPDAVRVRGSLQRPRGPSILVAVIFLAVGVAVVKPWSFGQSASPDASTSPPLAPGASAGVVTPAPPAPSPQVDPNGMLCLGGDVEQVVAYERTAKDEVRNWIAVHDVPATGPMDPGMARVTIHSSHVIGLGICGPFPGEGVPVAGRIREVLLVPTTPGEQAKDLGRPRQITLELGGQDAAVLYGSPQDPVVLPYPAAATLGPSSGADGTPGLANLPTFTPWSMGAYVIAFAFAWDDPTVVRWLGIDVLPSADVRP
jgi:hypothetical protein